MLLYYPQIEEDLTTALQLSYQLQLKGSIPLVETLEDRMLYLALYANFDHIDNTITVLGHDFAGYSFSFGIYKRTKDTPDRFTLEYIDQFGRDNPDISHHVFLSTNGYVQWFFGGLIYHGPHKTQDPLSIVLGSCSGWSIHT